MTSPASRRCRQGGVSIFTALFFLVLFGVLAALMARMTAVSHATASEDILAARAYQAARGGAEWGLYQVLRPDLVPPVLQACFAAANPPGLGANVAVGCESFPLAAPGDYFEGSRQFRIYRITATAQIPGPGLTVERQFRVGVEKCIDNAVPGAPMECLR